MENVGHLPAIGTQGNTPVSTGCASEGPTQTALNNTLTHKIDQASSNVHQRGTSNSPTSAQKAHWRHTPARGTQDNTPAHDTNQAIDNILALGGSAANNNRSVFNFSTAVNCFRNDNIDSPLNHDITLMSRANDTLATKENVGINLISRLNHDITLMSKANDTLANR